MRGKRSKQYRKLMQQYTYTFSFRPPYQILLDASIILSAQRHKMSLGKLLSSTLHSEIKPMITQCCIRHLYNLPASPEKEQAIAVAKEAERRRCGHHELEQPLSALECIESVVGERNKHKYVVASNEMDVRVKMRGVPGTPLIYIHKSVMILEPMAPASVAVKEGEEKAKIRAGLKTRRGASVATGEKRRRDEEDEQDVGAMNQGEQEEPVKKKFKVKGPKGPNPLSVKKAKKDTETQKSAGKLAEEEKAVIRKATKSDPQAAEKALGVRTTANETTNGITEGQRKKRNRKRKPKDESGGAVAAVTGSTAGDSD